MMKSNARLRFTTFALAALALVAVTQTSTVAQPAQPADGPEQRVREFVDAFNARNIDAMLTLAHDSIQWINIDGMKTSMETEGKATLRAGMERYFKSCPSCKSSLEWVQVAGTRVTALERASWEGKHGSKAQSSLSVYEFRDGKISRVYYFPAEADTLAGK